MAVGTRFLAAAVALAVPAGCSKSEAPPSERGAVRTKLPSDAGVPSAPDSGKQRVADPLAPNRAAWAVASGAPRPKNWASARPPKETQLSLTRLERGRVNPCEAPDPGFGVHREWTHVRPMGQFIAPRQGALAADGSFDLVVHFHGHRPARKEFVRTGEDLVLLGVSLGIGAAYGPPFARADVLEKLVAQVEKKLAAQHGVERARVRRVALSSWSRGYEAIERILAQPLGEKVDALILLDSLHASRKRKRRDEQMAPFVDFAKRAAAGEKFFFASHSSIDTSDYASTTETVHFLVAALGAVPIRATRRDPLGLDLIELFSRGDFHARGYTGNGKLDHCAHFGVYPDAIRGLARRWSASG